MTAALLAGALAGVAMLWLLPAPAGMRVDARPATPAVAPVPSRPTTRWRAGWSLLAGAGVVGFVSGPVGVVLGVAAATVAWHLLGRLEPPAARRHRQQVERDLPGLVHLVGAALETGCGTADAVRLACAACPGPAADLVGEVPTRLSLGLDPETAWAPVLRDPALAPLGRTMLRAHRSGSPVAVEVARLADAVAETSRERREQAARVVGVKAAVPLGLCLLPSFVLVGIVPLVVALLQSLHL